LALKFYINNLIKVKAL